MSAPPGAAYAANPGYVQWGGVFAGALIAAAISFVLLSFGSAIGLAVAPMTPSWRTASWIFGLLSGLWVLVVVVGSLAAGGYVAGRMRATVEASHTDEVEFRDGVHGLVVWALAIAFGAVLSATAATAMLAGAAGAAATENDSGFGSGGVASVAMGAEVDRLFRSDQYLIPVSPEVRGEAGRLLTTATSQPGLNSDDRTQLVSLVVATTGVSEQAAQERVRRAVTALRDDLAAARRAAVIMAFVTAAALVAGAAAAWQAACIGGRHRDSAAYPSLVLRFVRAKTVGPGGGV